ncbi:MAG: MOSC domain-containing protein [Planctomycetota bacterium]|nr:MOSC domain-containing protein [Planctomycetota bacterium]
MNLTVGALWRYPVKTLGGESLDVAEVTADGIVGDRVVQVRGPEGVRTSRRHHNLLGLHAVLGPDGEPIVDGEPWTSPNVLERVRAAAGIDATLVRSEGFERFDMLPLLVATDGAIAEFGRDFRRLRPNIVINGVEGMGEIEWPGSRLHIGEVVIDLESLRTRCPMTTVDPDTLVVDREVLLDIGRRFKGKLALNASVIQPGVIRVGDAARLITAQLPADGTATT